MALPIPLSPFLVFHQVLPGAAFSLLLSTSRSDFTPVARLSILLFPLGFASLSRHDSSISLLLVRRTHTALARHRLLDVSRLSLFLLPAENSLFALFPPHATTLVSAVITTTVHTCPLFSARSLCRAILRDGSPAPAFSLFTFVLFVCSSLSLARRTILFLLFPYPIEFLAPAVPADSCSPCPAAIRRLRAGLAVIQRNTRPSVRPSVSFHPTGLIFPS